ncbi:TetR/AcrR family transcriptional regulator [Arcanobacterium ihumii]|uniref:TetR/AcrR family transcriptional regulator n=1 Tax=Arcanobacterium ihumii TaxID=2138162 RepID=UPI000F5354C4|nr:TetR/AcrR family transcriptional regulator [Arcanobacterium ihumii]
MTAEERRRQIFTIAANEFATKGLQAASIDDIAAKAGVTQPYVFRLVKTKKALFMALVDDAYESLTTGLRQASSNETGLNAVELMAPVYLDRLTDNTRLQLLLQGLAACADAEIKEAMRKNYAQLWETVEEITQLDPVAVKTFLGLGLFMSAAAALDLGEVDEKWARGARTQVHGGLFEHIVQNSNRPPYSRKE